MRAREVVARVERLGGRFVRQVGSHARYEAKYRREDGTEGRVATRRDAPGRHTDRYLAQDREGPATGVREGMAAVSDMYTAEVRWEDGQWQASVRDLAGAHTHAKTMTALRKRLREVIVLMDDRADSDLQSEEAFSVDLVIDLTVQDDLAVEVNDSSSTELAAPAALGSTAPTAAPAAVTMAAPAAIGSIGIFSPSVITATRPDQALRQAAEARRRAAEAEAEAEHATAIAVLMAQRAGISMRDAAILLGISFQRVQQIAAAASARMLADSSP